MANKLVALFVKINRDTDTLDMYYCECSKYMFNLRRRAHDLLLKDKALRLDYKEYTLYTVFERTEFYEFRLWEETRSPGSSYIEITEDMCQVLTPKELLAESFTEGKR